MSRMTCSKCGREEESRAMNNCAQCGATYCNACRQQYNGCPHCASTQSVSSVKI
jgi:hypothetical protein